MAENVFDALQRRRRRVNLIRASLLGFLLSGVSAESTETAFSEPKENSEPDLLANPAKLNEMIYRIDAINASDFSNARISVSAIRLRSIRRARSIALTKSFVRGEMKDEEVVVVADVFGNGLAQIAEVIEPPKDAQTFTISKST